MESLQTQVGTVTQKMKVDAVAASFDGLTGKLKKAGSAVSKKLEKRL
jgi:glycerate-2-kinase